MAESNEVFRYSIKGDVEGADKTVNTLNYVEQEAIGSAQNIDEGFSRIGGTFDRLDAKSRKVLSGTLVASLRKVSKSVADVVLGTKNFSTEVETFADAADLMMERPKRGIIDFLSIFRVGMEEIKTEGGNAAGAIKVMASAASDTIGQIDRLKGVASVFDKVSSFANIFSGAFGRMSGSANQLGQDLNRLVRVNIQLTQTFNRQAAGWRMTRQVERQAISGALRDIEELGEAADLKDVIAVFGKIPEAIRPSVDGIRNVDEAIKRVRTQIGLLGAQDKQISRITQKMNTFAHSVAETSTTLQSTGKWSDRLAERSRRHARAIEAEFRAVQKMGVQIPPELAKTFEQVRDQFALAESKAKRLGVEGKKTGNILKDAGEKGARGFKGLNKVVDTTSSKVKNYSQSTSQAADANRMLMQYVQPQGMMNTGLQRVGSNVTKTSSAATNLSVSFGSLVGMAGMLGGTLGQMNPAFSAVLVGVSQMADQFVRSFTAMMSISGTGAQKVKAAMGVISSSFMGFGMMAMGAMVKMGMAGAEVKTLEITLRQIAKNLGKEAGVNIDKFSDHVMGLRDEIVATGITTREATNALSQFLRAKLPIGRVSELADAAKNLGVTVANMSSSEVFGRFIQFIQTGNSALLDAIGVAKNASVMMREYGKEIGKGANQLTTMEKQQALINGIIAETATVQGVYNESMKTAGKQLSSMKRLFEESILTLGRRFEPTLALIITAMNKVLKAFTNLAPEVHDSIANFIKWTAVVGISTGAALKLVPALKSLMTLFVKMGTKMLTASPQILAIALAIGAIVAVVKGFKTLWDQNFGGIKDSVMELVNVVKLGLGPIIADIRYWIGQIGDRFKIIVREITDGLKVVVGFIAGALDGTKSKFGSVFSNIRDLVNGFMRVVHGAVTIITQLLQGDADAAFRTLERVVSDVLTQVGFFFENFVAKAATWGWNLIVGFANNMQRAASSVVAKVMSYIGSLIGRFIKPGSPPKEGPLSHIAEWGQGVMDTYLRAFGTADFGMLRDIMAPIQKSLQDAFAAGTIGEKEIVPRVKAVRENVAALLADLRKTGELNEGIMDSISEKLGVGGKDIVEYIRRLGAHQRAMKNLSEAQGEYAEAEATGFVTKEVKDRLAAAEEEVDATKDAVSWQKEYMAAQQDTMDLQVKQLKLLERMAKALESAAKAAADGLVPETEYELDFEEKGEEEKKSLFDDLVGEKEVLGGVSKEWSDMKAKVDDAIASVKEWFELPWRDKLISISGWIKDITGIDLEQWWKDNKQAVEDFIEANFVQWWEDFKDQINESWENVKPSFDKMKEMFEEIKKAFGDATGRGIDFKAILDVVFKAVNTVFMVIWKVISGILMGVAKAFDNVIAAIANIWTVFQSGIQMIILLFQGDMDGAREKAEEVLTALKDYFVNMFTAIADLITGFLDETFPGLTDAISQFFVDLVIWWNDTKETVTEAWVLFWDELITKAVTTVTSIVDTVTGVTDTLTEWVGGLVDVGTAIVDNIWKGVTDAWEGFKSNLSGKWEEVKAMLPFSEPHDKSSPLYGLGKSGAAILQNIMDGMGDVDLTGQFSAQLESMRAQIAGSSITNTYGRTMNFNNGAFSGAFPNVTQQQDAAGLMETFRSYIDDADTMRRGR